MELNEITPSNDIIIVDREAFYKMKQLACKNEEDIHKEAKEMYLSWINMGGMELKFRISDVSDFVGHGVISELNYDIFRSGMKFPDEVKYRIAEDITKHVNHHFSNIRKDCFEFHRTLSNSEYRKHTVHKVYLITCWALSVIGLLAWIVFLMWNK
ncbi:MAG: hypothetical protein RR346_03800 [Bacteroidales bacterium]